MAEEISEDWPRGARVGRPPSGPEDNAIPEGMMPVTLIKMTSKLKIFGVPMSQAVRTVLWMMLYKKLPLS